MAENKPDELTVEERWIARYRRYHSDSWNERSFTSEVAAGEFQRNYLYDRGSDAQCVVKHFIEESK